MRCPRCGKEQEVAGAFCMECGAPLNSQLQPNVPPQQGNGYYNQQQVPPNNYGNPNYNYYRQNGYSNGYGMPYQNMYRRPPKKNMEQIAGGILCVILAIFLCVFILFYRSKKNISPDAPTATEEDKVIDTNISDCHIVYLKHEIVDDFSGDKCLIVYYEFTNNSDKIQTFSSVAEDTAFQDGVKLDKSIFILNDESNDRYSEIKKGATITVCSSFILRNETSDVELYINKWITIDDTPIDSMLLSIE